MGILRAANEWGGMAALAPPRGMGAKLLFLSFQVAQFPTTMEFPMNFPLPRCSLLALLAGLVSVPTDSADIQLSGTVTDLSGSVLPGAGVVLVGAGNATSAGAIGRWSISGKPTGIVAQTRTPARKVASHLELVGSHLRLRMDGADALGRKSQGLVGMENAAPKPGETVGALRAAVPEMLDTLLYSWKGIVRARVGITSLVAGDLGTQAIDTSTGSFSPGSLSYEGQIYRTVMVGSQTWMAQNLNFKPAGADSGWCPGAEGQKTPGEAASCAEFGRLYTWATLMKLSDTCNFKVCASQVQARHQGICPKGWRVPSDADWAMLVAFVERDVRVGSDNGGLALKSTTGWIDGGENGLDFHDFGGLPAGYRDSDSSFSSADSYTRWWSATEAGGGYAWLRGLRFYNPYVETDFVYKTGALSARCLKD